MSTDPVDCELHRIVNAGRLVSGERDRLQQSESGRLYLERFCQALALCDVPDDGSESCWFAVLILNNRRTKFSGEARPVSSHEHVFKVSHSTRLKRRGHSLRRSLTVFRSDEIKGIPADRLLGLTEPMQHRCPFVAQEDLTIDFCQRDCIRASFYEAAVPRFALAERLFSPLLFGDVTDCCDDQATVARVHVADSDICGEF